MGEELLHFTGPAVPLGLGNDGVTAQGGTQGSRIEISEGMKDVPLIFKNNLFYHHDNFLRSKRRLARFLRFFLS